MYTITLLDYSFTYSIIYRKNRKSLQLKFVNPNCLQVTVPLGYSTSSVEKILYEKKDWILKQSIRLSTLASSTLNQSLLSGSKVLFMGDPYSLVWKSTETPQVQLQASNKKIILSLSECSDARKHLQACHLLKEWYLNAAKEILWSRTFHWATKMKVEPKGIILKDQKSRWGSCSSIGNVNYNWRIIMAPPKTIDYLIIHELSHLRFLNHSKDFWMEVEHFCPNYKESRNWLKINGSLLMRIFNAGHPN